MISIITNSCTHSTIFIKNTLKVHVWKAKVYTWFNGASPYSQYCGGIRKLQWKTYLLKQEVKSYMCIK
jgi:hypothetical protein